MNKKSFSQRIKEDAELKKKYISWLNNPITREVIAELRSQGEPALVNLGQLTKDYSQWLLGVFSGWFGVIQKMESLDEDGNVFSDIETKYSEESVC